MMLEFDAATHDEYRGLGYSLESLVEAHAHAIATVDGLAEPVSGRMVTIDADRYLLIDQADAEASRALVALPLSRVIAVRARYGLRSREGEER